MTRFPDLREPNCLDAAAHVAKVLAEFTAFGLFLIAVAAWWFIVA